MKDFILTFQLGEYVLDQGGKIIISKKVDYVLPKCWIISHLSYSPPSI